MKFTIKDFFIKFNKNPSFLRVWSHIQEKALIDDFIFYAVN